MRVALRWIARPLELLLGLALVILATQGFAQEHSEFRPAPRFEGATIPDPPRQREQWQRPATTLPRFFVTATATLFVQGLADPRGCDYRVIEIGVGSVWSGDGGVVKTHGWVLPAKHGEKTRFAIAWSGLVYPTVSIGEPADLAADVQTIDREARSARDAGAKSVGGSDVGFNRFGTNNETSSVSATSLHAIKVCLLLRLGRADLAETVWAAGTIGLRDNGDRAAPENADLSSHGISYASLGNDLAWYLFDRALCAHMRGDDAIALADAQKLTALRQSVEMRAEAMGYPHPPRLVDRGEGPAPYIAFLDQLPELLADQERRAREPKRRQLPPPTAGNKERITALIAELDQVAVRQMSQPGGVSLGASPAVKSLIELEDDAVEPLIQDLQTDVRLTRSVHFHRDFGRSRFIMGAHEAAYTALSGILKTSFFGAASTGDNLSARGLEGRRVVADRVRSYWQKNRQVPLVERWYRTLADNGAAPGEWLQAAGNIVQHENVSIVAGSTAFGVVRTTQLPAGVRPKLRGESLREKRNPSVGELMAKRINEIDRGGPLDANSADQFTVGSANQMATLLAEWNNEAALPVLKARVERCARLVQAGQERGTRFHNLELAIASMTNLRTKAGDQAALDDYAGWVRTLTPTNFHFSHVAMFEPLWRNPDHPAMIAAAAALFEDPKSPWNPSVRPLELETDLGYRLEVLGSSLLGLKSFRVLVLRALADRTRVGTIEVDADGRVTEIQGEHKTVSDRDSTSISLGSPAEPFKPGPSAMPLRVADLVCERLQQLEGVPRFLKEWPLAKRDQAIAACVAYLKQCGERYRENDASRAIRAEEPGHTNYEPAILAFDPLDHPATAGDVAAGRAIFSLDGVGAEIRRFALPSLPLDARWTKLEVFPDDPPRVRVYDAEGNEQPNTEALQMGRVWQAEEVRQGDRWQRYYGFAGRHALARVAAEEIEFVAPWHTHWVPVSTDLDARLVVKDAATIGPVPVEFSFRNHRGVDSTAPTGLVNGAGGALTVREGITFRLIRVSDKPVEPDPVAALQGGTREKPFPPEAISGRALRRHPKGTSTQTLGPAGTASVFQLDLRSLFPIDQPGRYRLEITFDDLKTGDGTPGKVETEFSVVRKTE